MTQTQNPEPVITQERTNHHFVDGIQLNPLERLSKSPDLAVSQEKSKNERADVYKVSLRYSVVA